MNKPFSKNLFLVLIVILTVMTSYSLNLSVRNVIQGFGKGISQGLVSASVGNEISGLVASRQLSNVLWIHNDSGDDAKIYAINDEGKHLTTVNLIGAEAFDYEDIAIDSENRIYVADIGDNGKLRKSIQIYRFKEPTDIKPSINITPEVINLYYPNKSHNAETLIIDPIDGSIFILTKTDKEESILFKAQPPLKSSMYLEKVQSLNFNGERTTAGDISFDGKVIIVRTYNSLYAWPRSIENTVEESMLSHPLSFPVQPEKQGEAVGFSAKGNNYFTISEGNTPSIFLYPTINIIH